MNVTLDLPDELCVSVRERAEAEKTSFAALVADLVKKGMTVENCGEGRPQTWADAFSGSENDPYLDRDFPLEDRKAMKIREFNFEE